MPTIHRFMGRESYRGRRRVRESCLLRYRTLVALPIAVLLMHIRGHPSAIASACHVTGDAIEPRLGVHGRDQTTGS